MCQDEQAQSHEKKDSVLGLNFERKETLGTAIPRRFLVLQGAANAQDEADHSKDAKGAR